MCPQQESNLHFSLRRAALCPLSYGDNSAEGVRVELTRALLPAGFQDRFLAIRSTPPIF